jgi:hypothetical protein
MSRRNGPPPPVHGAARDQGVYGAAAPDRARTAHEISAQALALASRARAAGMTALSRLLEAAALEAVTHRYPEEED